jgi:hypothetical protein
MIPRPGAFSRPSSQLGGLGTDQQVVDRIVPTLATIKATCPTCGDLELKAHQVRVFVCADDRSASYAFRCGSCQMMVAKATDDRVVGLLVASGVELVNWQLPAELWERHCGPAISWDDILAFHFLINGEGAMTRVMAELVQLGLDEPAS